MTTFWSSIDFWLPNHGPHKYCQEGDSLKPEVTGWTVKGSNPAAIIRYYNERNQLEGDSSDTDTDTGTDTEIDSCVIMLNLKNQRSKSISGKRVAI